MPSSSIQERWVCCPLCHGEGGEFDNVLWKGVGGGPWIECGLCQGFGQITMKLRMEYLRCFKKNKEAR